MNSRLPTAFLMEPISIPLENILPSKSLPQTMSVSKKFHQIHTSILEIGLIEPLIVTPKIVDTPHHMLLDGHARLVVLREIGHLSVPCLIANDDESFTYNSRVNRLSTIQEHYMIRRAVDRGVSAQRLASALNVGVSQISKKVNLLNGICLEAIELLKDRIFPENLSAVLRKMKPTRQIECVELMISANILTITYAEAMLAATPPELLEENEKPKKVRGVSREQIAKMEREMGGVQEQYKIVEQTYGKDVLNLVLARGYLVRLLENDAITRTLIQKYPDIFSEFESIVKTVTLEQP
ncbi:plasmid partitioning protein RepB C-terminal domain-containing protein [Herbaspirillum sp. RV1423]|uniref:plasmid partitioning protein RepB C-terminal domain-containing protein n=1 Tax=Herbaspirillum sp. RV1423 TaxID=1443993 RepID=UPI00055513BC|nr:plasmid partitioning protein RepB C-terminal domain-containing protein [Herbaspirillum sp. RV1423]